MGKVGMGWAVARSDVERVWRNRWEGGFSYPRFGCKLNTLCVLDSLCNTFANFDTHLIGVGGGMRKWCTELLKLHGDDRSQLLHRMLGVAALGLAPPTTSIE